MANSLARLSGISPWIKQLGGFAERALSRSMTSMLGEDFDARLARVPLSLGQSGVDPFGLDPEWTKHAIACTAFLYRKYFRCEAYGTANVPRGRVLLIANHSGQIPVDAAMIGAAMFMDVEPPRFVRAMVEKWAHTLPFVSMLFARVGQVVGVPENAKRLLDRDEALLVFPEGSRGISKTYQERYKLVDFGLGFMRLAIQTNTPIIPVAVIGGEEQYISVAQLDSVAKLLRIPAFPIMPQILLPGGQLPLPTKYRLHFGEPMRFDGDSDDDDAVIEEKVWLVKQTLQAMVNRGLKERRHVFW